MIVFKRWQLLAAGFGLIGLINAFALGGAWYNRQSEPDSVLVLTERELSRIGGRAGSENSGLALRLHWEMPEDGQARQVFSEAQMRRAGFELGREGKCRRPPERAVLVALELDGPAYRNELAKDQQAFETARHALAETPEDPRRIAAQENAQRQLNWTQNRSRLYAVDIDRERDALRQRWPDRSRYAIVNGRVQAAYGCEELTGTLTGIDVGPIHAPRPLHASLAELPSNYWRTEEPSATPYRIEVAFGQRLEPWLRAVERLDPAP